MSKRAMFWIRMICSKGTSYLMNRPTKRMIMADSIIIALLSEPKSPQTVLLLDGEIVIHSTQ